MGTGEAKNGVVGRGPQWMVGGTEARGIGTKLIKHLGYTYSVHRLRKNFLRSRASPVHSKPG